MNPSTTEGLMMSQVVSAALHADIGSRPSPPSSCQTYLLEWSDKGRGFSSRNVDIVQMLHQACSSRPSSITSSTPLLQALPSEHQGSDSDSPKSRFFNPFSPAYCEQASTSTEVRGDRVYHIRHLKWNSKSYELLDGAGMATTGLSVPGRTLMAVQQECISLLSLLILRKGSDACLSFKATGSPESTSTYAEINNASSQSRSVSMCKLKGKAREPFRSSNRSFDDFDGVHYKVHTTFLGDIIVTRTDDQAEVARFTRARRSVHEIGRLVIWIPVSESLLHLLLCTTFMKYLRDRAMRMGRMTSSA